MISKSWYSRYALTVQFALVLVGTVMILAAILIPREQILRDLLLSFGTGMVSATLLVLVGAWTKTDAVMQLQESIGFQQDIYKTGLSQVHLSTDSEFYKRFQSARRIDILVTTGRLTFTTHEAHLKRVVEQGGRVRVLIASEEALSSLNPELRAALCNPNPVAQYQEAVASLEALQAALGHVLQRGLFEVRTLQFFPFGALTIVDDYLRYVPYVPHRKSNEVPTFDVGKRGLRERDLFDVYEEIFEDLWNRGTVLLQKSGSGRSA